MPVQKQSGDVSPMSDVLTVGTLNARIQELQRELGSAHEQIKSLEEQLEGERITREANQSLRFKHSDVVTSILTKQSLINNAGDLRLDSREVDQLRVEVTQLLESLAG